MSAESDKPSASTLVYSSFSNLTQAFKQFYILIDRRRVVEQTENLAFQPLHWQVQRGENGPQLPTSLAEEAVNAIG